MRIVYDDEMQSEMVLAVKEYMSGLRVKEILRYDDHVQMQLLKERLNGFLEVRRMSIGNTVTHAHGIGNNCKYPVYYHPENSNEIQQCGSINLNYGLYGEGYVSCEDYNRQRISPIYKLSRWGIEIKEKGGS